MKSLSFAVLALAITIAAPASAAPAQDLARAEALFAAGDYVAAAKIYDTVLAREPNNLDALLAVSEMSLDLEEYDNALAYAQAAVRVAPDNPDAVAARGWAYAAVGQTEKARTDFEKVLAEAPHTKALEGRAWLFNDAGDHVRALEDFQAAYRADPSQIGALVSSGHQLAELGRPEEAMIVFDRALSSEPENYYALASKAGQLSARGDLKAAVAVYQTAARLYPQDDELQVWLGSALSNDGSTAKAMDAYQKAVRLNPESRDGWWSQATLLYHDGEYRRAIRAYDRAVQIDPVNVTLLVDRGVARAAASDTAGGRADLEAALKIEPKSPYAHNGLGRLELTAERYDAAVKDFDAAISYLPTYSPAFVNRSIAYRELGRFDRALKDINQAITLAPDTPSYIAMKGVIYSRMGDHLQAVEAFDASLKSGPDDASVWWARAASKAELGDAAGAEADKAQARRLDPEVGG